VKFIPAFVVLCLASSMLDVLAKPSVFRGTVEARSELIAAAYKILELGYSCHASGASIEACRAQLATQINQRLRQ
jgi:hypothetical protein